MKITADTITVETLRALRKDMVRATIQAFDLMLKIERSEIAPDAAAVELTEILAALQIESNAKPAPSMRYFRNEIGDRWVWDGSTMISRERGGLWHKSKFSSPDDLVSALNNITETAEP